MQKRSRLLIAVFTFITSIAVSSSAFAAPQSLGAAGTVSGSVTDPQGLPVPGAKVVIHNAITGYQRDTVTDSQGKFHFVDVPQNRYHVQVSIAEFQPADQDVEVRTLMPNELKIQLALASESTSVEVHSQMEHLIENVPTAHTDVDSSLFSKLAMSSPASGLSDTITQAAPGVVADSNGFFHPLGDHAETGFSVDNQPITDQQSKQFSSQLPLNAIQSLEVIAGAAPAEFGDKSSLVINVSTRSGMGLSRPTGGFSVTYGSFGTVGENFSLGLGNAHMGNFIAANTTRSGRYLDTPEFATIHDVGNNQTIFDRFDYQPGAHDTLHLNLFAARSWFQTPNTYDQQAAGQDQRELVRSYNIAPGWVHLFGATTAVTITPFFRQDHVGYFPSRDAFSDLPATVSQQRRLTNVGVKADVAIVHGIHNAKFGVQVLHNILDENFHLGITDPAFNAICVTAANLPVTAPAPLNPANCAASGFLPNPALQPGLIPIDLTRGGSLLAFRGHTDIKQEAVFAQDNLTLGPVTVQTGLRFDNYNGLTHADGFQPRLGVSYLFKPTNTLLRISYSRFFETPYNENLILSSTTGVGGLSSNALGAFGTTALDPGRRNQYNAGLQQSIGRLFIIDASYVWKYTNNAFDFDNLFNSPIAFPIEWRKSKIDGLSMRLNLTNWRGFSAFTVIGHTRARFFGPETGGLIFNSPLSDSVFRIDHDQAFQQTTNLRYQRGKDGPWIAFTWRFDSGMVAGRVPDLASTLTLTADQQTAIGFFCGNQFASLGNPITQCNSGSYGAKLVKIPPAGTENDDTNPARISPRNLFDLGAGIDNLFHTEHPRWTLQFTALNLTNKAALYNFLSTFSGTHFVTPRSYQMEFGVVF